MGVARHSHVRVEYVLLGFGAAVTHLNCQLDWAGMLAAWTLTLGFEAGRARR